MIQLTKDGLIGNAEIAVLARRFEQSHVFRLAELLHPDLMRLICVRLQCTTWTTRDDGRIAREAAPEKLSPANILNFAANTPEFLELMRQITRCDQISWFAGRVYRMEAVKDHFDSWHTDMGSSQDRLVGMSVNLSPRSYKGGVFRLRDEVSGEILCELPNSRPGDAIFFRISPRLKHMVTPVEGPEPKTAFAGWFRSGEIDFYTALRGSSRSLIRH